MDASKYANEALPTHKHHEGYEFFWQSAMHQGLRNNSNKARQQDAGHRGCCTPGLQIKSVNCKREEFTPERHFRRRLRRQQRRLGLPG